MQGNPPDLPVREAAAQDPLALSLDTRRVLGRRARQSVRAEFRFDPATPLVVAATFVPDQGPSVTWRIGRELLSQGLHEGGGAGSIRIWPAQGWDSDTAWLLLESPKSSALLELPVVPIVGWLDATYELVPQQDEAAALDWDGFMAGLLDGFGPSRG
ncbi:SsgA family sporulation/cell division regulator [Streptacidiphilus carbonis]|uniref:SsgA family sporulation/cell division regulator n=1 Tax=Streptacidiphilus carbonis TaxID=105422 RepID=UPI0005A7FCF5|nr:SsgA family sporulation/cell division regulator [Streptacidiphilus carbonis]